MGDRSRSRVVDFKAMAMVVVALALVASACSSASSVDDQAAAGAVSTGSELDLSGASIESSDIEELDVVRFSGIDLDGDLSQLELVAVVDGVDPMDMVLFVDDQGLYTIFPLHPKNPGTGGDVSLRLRAGAGEDREFDIEVAGLPPAPGAWGRAIEAMSAELESRAEQLGMSPAQISATPMDELGDDAAVVRLIAGFVDDGSSDDLESMPARPGDEFSAEQVDLLDSIIEKMGLAKVVPLLADLSSIEAMSSSRTVSAPPPVVQATAVRAAFAQAASCRVKLIPIANGEQLAAAVAKGLAARDALNDPSTFSEETAETLSDVATAGGIAVALGVATGVLAPAALAVGAVIGAANAAYATARLMLVADAGNYPTRFVGLDVGLTPPNFNEDFTKKGRVTSVDVTAASTGFNAADALSGIAAGAADAVLAGGFGKITGKLGETAGAQAAVAGSETLRQTAMGEAIAQGKESLEFCPQRWTVDINSSKYVQVLAVNGNLQVDESSFAFEPLRVGDDILRFETRADAFPGVFAITDKPVATEPLDVVSTPSKIKVKKAGDEVAINASLVNADTWDAAWEKTGGTWADGLSEVTEAREVSRRLQTPTDKKLFPITVTITSLSDTGLRAGATDERSARVIIELADLIVTPDPGYVQPKKTLQFTATDEEGKPRDVKWQATGGSINSSGLYTAGKKSGAYTVTATATDDPSVTETVTVNIGNRCPVGTWILRSQDFFNQVAAQAGGQINFLSGENRLVMREDGSMSSIRAMWSFDAITPEGTLRLILDGEDFGTWVATEDLMVFEVTGGSVDTQMLVKMNGSFQPIPGLPTEMGFGTDPLADQMPYTCEEDILTFTAAGVTSTFDRIDDGG